MSGTTFSAVHGCIIDDIGLMIFWYEKKNAPRQRKSELNYYA
jgi:hypothetical protein